MLTLIKFIESILPEIIGIFLGILIWIPLLISNENFLGGLREKDDSNPLLAQNKDFKGSTIPGLKQTMSSFIGIRATYVASIVTILNVYIKFNVKITSAIGNYGPTIVALVAIISLTIVYLKQPLGGSKFLWNFIKLFPIFGNIIAICLK